MTRNRRVIVPSLLIALGLFLQSSLSQAVTLEELAQRLDALEAENAVLRQKVARLESGPHVAPAEPVTAVAAAPVLSTASSPASSPAATAGGGEASTYVSSYGEIGYTRPSKRPSVSNVDVQRAVIGLTHRFDENTKMVGEWEWEHAVTSSTDTGESEVEQLYVEHSFRGGWTADAGLYLLPAGLINQHHEPTAYYGVYRPDVDTKIIPSTWREVGLGISRTTDSGLTFEGGLTTAPNLSQWDPTTDEGRLRGPLAAIHGEGQFAAAHDLAGHLSVNWRVPGALVGASVFASKVGQDQPGFLGNDSRLLLWEVHGRYQPGRWDLAAEYARGTLSDTEALNEFYLHGTTPNPTLVPALFYGGYAQAAYRVWSNDYFKITPFARYEILNAAAGYGSLAGAPARTGDEHIWTLGTSLYVGDGVVFKADYRGYRNDRYPSAVPLGYTKGDSLNLGVGYSF